MSINYRDKVARFMAAHNLLAPECADANLDELLLDLRCDHRRTNDSERIGIALQQTKGKRLSYRAPTGEG